MNKILFVLKGAICALSVYLLIFFGASFTRSSDIPLSTNIVKAEPEKEIKIESKKEPETISRLNELKTPLPKKVQDSIYELVIPSIGVIAPVKAMGLEDDGRMAVPNNYSEIGWYKFGGKPGQIGSSVMGAHVDNGSTINGVFKNLKDVQVGGVIYVNDFEGNKFKYKVSKINILPKDLVDTREVFSNQGVARLNLITCHGKWLPAQNTYESRLVVFAELI